MGSFGRKLLRRSRTPLPRKAVIVSSEDGTLRIPIRTTESGKTATATAAASDRVAENDNRSRAELKNNNSNRTFIANV